MFELNKALESWCEAVLGDQNGQADQMDELQDHLYCEIGRLQKTGLSKEAAFLKATERLGDPQLLRTEFTKNHRFLQTLYACEKAQIKASGLTKKQFAVMHIGISLLFATLMIATPLLMEDFEKAQTIIFAVLLPLWFIIYMLLPGTRQSIACEWRYLRRLVMRR